MDEGPDGGFGFSREGLALALESTDAILWKWSPEDDVSAAYPSGESLFGPDVDSLEDVLALVHPDDSEQLERGFQRAVATGEPVSAEYRIQTDDGTRWLSTRGKTIGDGEEVLIGITQDITEQKGREQELQRQNERLDEFASIVSHDLQNPLNVAQGRIELAQEECESDHLDTAADAVDRSLELVDDLLTLAREGERVQAVDPVELGPVARSCWRGVETPDATLSVQTDRVIQADASRLRQLFQNLMTNAVEHGGAGVTVTIGDLDDGIYVADDGDGIPPDVRERVFDEGYSTGQEGTGFGLNIVQAVVEGHGWEISVTESEAGGARFEITGVESERTCQD